MAGDGVGEPPPPREGGGEQHAAPDGCISLPSQPHTHTLSSSSNRLQHPLVNPAPAASMEGGQVTTTAPIEVPPKSSKVEYSVNPKPHSQAPPTPYSFDGGASSFNGGSHRVTYSHPQALPPQPPAQPPQPSHSPSKPIFSILTSPIIQPHMPSSSSSEQAPPHIPSYSMCPQNLPWTMHKPPAKINTFKQDNSIIHFTENTPHAIIDLQPAAPTIPDIMHVLPMHKPSYAQAALGLTSFCTAEDT
ncbi:hypothetical protein LIER_30812 [Lithospermum erythrorhizon]|uniref:Uncharacterized protein n=1 Tax=Lithospermum erythrorhizon TaxID=34254 RepID=A0AAV3RNY6_LITER